ncbi:MAG: methyltransferase domain-containing protein, partial [Sulfitobacter sp.]|nr:methyltransferase domain-containing protein [Sulfitobacter sp.]
MPLVSTVYDASKQLTSMFDRNNEEVKGMIPVLVSFGGQGGAVNLMAAACPNSPFIGIDNHTAAIAAARCAAEAAGLTNAVFVEADAAAIEGEEKWRARFEYICAFDAIHDQTRPLEALRSIRYMLAPGGLFSMVDIKAGSQHKDNLD